MCSGNPSNILFKETSLKLLSNMQVEANLWKKRTMVINKLTKNAEALTTLIKEGGDRGP